MTNFKNIIEKYYIQIPIIQRDYAQGRLDSDINEIRYSFIGTILSHLEEEKPLHLDFVYGSIKNYDEKQYFMPLDGQQRLTTLFLLHWYFGSKESLNIGFLTKFTYETRSSSREFCNKLVKSTIDFDDNNIVAQIKNSSWFMPFWEKDPTIKSMFTMIQTIHNTFYEKYYFNKLDLITFQFFELEKFGLDDDLYIKMNARGKVLTKFENFKANFEQLLGYLDKDLEKEFSRKVDNEWTNNFWEYKDKKFLIDTAFMNYFYFITEMLYVKSKKVEKELAIYELKSKFQEIYSDKNNVLFLFRSLDMLVSINQSFDNTFTSFAYQADRVVLFDSEVNLLEKVIKSEKGNLINLQQKILLYLIINYIVNDKGEQKDLVDLLRVARNLLERIRGLKQSQLKYTSNLKYENVNSIIKVFTEIDDNIYNELVSKNIDLTGSQITKTSLTQEIKKAEVINSTSLKDKIFKLEDYKYLKGDISNFLFEDIELLSLASEYIPTIYKDKDELIARAMLSVSDYRLWRGWAGGSSKYFFGKKGYWEILLSSDNKDYYKKFLLSYQLNKFSLQSMIDQYSINSIEKDWRYYFIKYENFLNKYEKISHDNNIFAWYDDYSMEKMGGTNLNAYHVNPYLKTVAIIANIHYNVYKWDGYSKLQIRGKIKELYSEMDGWRILFSESIDKDLQRSLIKDFELQESYSDSYLMNIFQDKDRVERMVEFLEVIKSN